MKIEIAKWTSQNDWIVEKGNLKNSTSAQLVLAFGDANIISETSLFDNLKLRYPSASIVGCSTSGNICSDTVVDHCVVVTAIEFEKSRFKIVKSEVKNPEDSLKVGSELMKELATNDLRHVYILSDGLNVNGSELAKGLNSLVPENVKVSGGLAGDGDRFKRTWIMANASAQPNQVVAIGFYGEDLQFKTGCFHGWETFGVNRIVTRSERNVLYEIDNEPALPLYKKYLGEEYTKDLPSSGLRFPLCVFLDGKTLPVVRTLLAVDESKQSMTFAGDVPNSKNVFLMKSTTDGLIQAANLAAKDAKIETTDLGLAIAVSCVGRRLVLSKLVEEETEEVQKTLGANFVLTGFYSYGELAPLSEMVSCHLHNQTMTITTITEK